jgi:hypothetical protein
MGSSAKLMVSAERIYVACSLQRVNGCVQETAQDIVMLCGGVHAVVDNVFS